MAEYLSKDILEENHLKSFAPFRLLQWVLGSCRVDARDRFVTPPSILQKIFSITIVILSLISVMYFVKINYSDLKLSYPRLYGLCVFGIVLNYFIYFLNIMHVRYACNDLNVKFYLKMQEIDRTLKIDTKDYLYNLQFNVNLITLSVWFSVIILMAFLTILNGHVLGFHSLGLYSAQFTWIIELLHYSNLILYFYSRILFINTIVINHLNLNEKSDVQTNYSLKFVNLNAMRKLANETNDFLDSDTVEYLREIFDGLRTFTVLYRFQMFLLCFKLVAYSIIFVEFFLLASQKNVNVDEERIALPTIVLGDFLMLVAICVRWETLFGEIKETKYLCTTVLATYKQGPLRKKASKMIKVIEETPPAFSVYDMWDMDATTILKIFHTITNVIVALLQLTLQ